jgi:hypothetical protein
MKCTVTTVELLLLLLLLLLLPLLLCCCCYMLLLLYTDMYHYSIFKRYLHNGGFSNHCTSY